MGNNRQVNRALKDYCKKREKYIVEVNQLSYWRKLYANCMQIKKPPTLLISVSGLFPVSGKRGSNPRPSAWEAGI